MKLVKQSYEIIGTPKSLDEAWCHAAMAARNCYQSQKTVTDESEEDFCRRILLKGKDITSLSYKEMEELHMAPLEFGVVYLTIPGGMLGELEAYHAKYKNNKYSRINLVFEKDWTKNTLYVTTNLRVILEHHWEDDLKYSTEPMEHHVKSCCFRMVTSIHVYKDLTRHEGEASFAIESTRYCKYTSKKFGSGLTFIWHPRLAGYTAKQLHLDDEGVFDNILLGLPGDAALLFRNFIQTEVVYDRLINDFGWTAQDAATVLTQDTKATVMMCGYADSLEHIFRLRAEECSGPVLPQVAEIVKPMYESYRKWIGNKNKD